jgi:hypothetical protein
VLSALQEHVQLVVEACQGTPLALAVVCGLMRCGYCSAGDFLRIYSDRALPIDHGGSDTNPSSYLPFESRQTHERVLRCGLWLSRLQDKLLSPLPGHACSSGFWQC